jgi:hypothetical protein
MLVRRVKERGGSTDVIDGHFDVSFEVLYNVVVVVSKRRGLLIQLLSVRGCGAN